MLLYGVSAWTMAADYLLKKIQVVQNKCLRVILGVGCRTRIGDLHAAADVGPVRPLIRDVAEGFYRRTATSDNALISGITAIRNVRGVHRLPYEHLPIFVQKLEVRDQG